MCSPPVRPRRPRAEPEPLTGERAERAACGERSKNTEGTENTEGTQNTEGTEGTENAECFRELRAVRVGVDVSGPVPLLRTGSGAADGHFRPRSGPSGEGARPRRTGYALAGTAYPRLPGAAACSRANSRVSQGSS